MKRSIKHLAIAAASLAVAAQTASAAFVFNNGDIVLAFQGTGDNTNVYFNLGSTINLRNGVTSGVIGNISGSLATAYGSTWFDRSDLYVGAMGNLNSGSFDATVSGDPTRTFYVSRGTATTAGSVSYSGFTSASMASAASGFNGLETTLISGLSSIGTPLTLNGDNSASLGTNQANSWTQWNPLTGNVLTGFNQQTAFNVFSGGIQNNFGPGGQTLIDIQRIIVNTTGANPTQAVGTGVTFATIAIADNGDISVSPIPEPTTGLLTAVAGIALAFRRRRNAK